MDRHVRWALACCGLGFVLLGTTTGCRNMRAPEVPPDPAYYAPTTTAPQVGFSSEPASVNPYGAAVAGTPTTPGNNYAAPPTYSEQPAIAGSGAGSTLPGGDPAIMGAGATLPEPAPLQALPGSSPAGAMTMPGLVNPADPGSAPTP